MAEDKITNIELHLGKSDLSSLFSVDEYDELADALSQSWLNSWLEPQTCVSSLFPWSGHFAPRISVLDREAANQAWRNLLIRATGATPRVALSASPTDSELTAEEESAIVGKLREMQFYTDRLVATMDNNLSVLESSVREVRTAREIAGQSNRMANRRLLKEGNHDLKVFAK